MKLAALILLALPLVAQVTPAPEEPAQVFSSGAGVEGLGPAQPFGYVSVSQHVGSGTFTTQIYEAYRMKGGLVGTSVRAGVSKILWVLGPLTIGIVGDAGVAEGATGSASGALSGRGFAGMRFGKSPFGLIVSAQTMKLAGSGENSRFTVGLSYSLFK